MTSDCNVKMRCTRMARDLIIGLGLFVFVCSCVVYFGWGGATYAQESAAPVLPVWKKPPPPLLLFDKRLDTELGSSASVHVDNLTSIEKRVFQFAVPSKVTLAWPDRTVPFTFQVYGVSTLCPKCTVVPVTSAAKNIDAYLQANDRNDQTLPTVCGCGEAQGGTGRTCFATYGKCTYQNSFKREDNMWQTYSRLEYSPPDRPTPTVASLVRQLLRPWKRRPHCTATATAPLVALHSNCGGRRGKLLSDLRDVLHSYGHCWKNRDIQLFEPTQWYYGDSASNRNAVKTDISSCYMVTAALENTVEDDYVTEKLYEALVSGSVPLIWGTKNLEYLPHPDAAIRVSDFASPQRLKAYLNALAKNATFYYERHQKWKESGRIRTEFAQLLFRGDNFSPCRICEAVSNTNSG